MNTQVYSISGIDFLAKVVKETEIDWKTQGKIHQLLNSAFGRKSQSFIAKTFARTQPSYRVMFFMDDILVGHMGISADQLLINGIYVDVACMGLWCVGNIRVPRLKLEIATSVIKLTMSYLTGKGVELAIGVTNSKAIEQRILPWINTSIINVPLIGHSTRSKETDKFLLFNCCADNDYFTKLSLAIIEQGEVSIKGEVF